MGNTTLLIEIGVFMTDSRVCPFCAERIKRRAKLCRFCGKEVVPLYVDNSNANRQIIKIIDSVSSGVSYSDISDEFNQNNDLVVNDDEISKWTPEFVEILHKRFTTNESVSSENQEVKAPPKIDDRSKYKSRDRRWLIGGIVFFLFIALPIMHGINDGYTKRSQSNKSSFEAGSSNSSSGDSENAEYTSIIENNGEGLGLTGNITAREAATVAALISASGYACSSISNIRRFLPFSSHNGYTVSCNHFSYEYEVVDMGGNWQITVK